VRRSLFFAWILQNSTRSLEPAQAEVKASRYPQEQEGWGVLRSDGENYESLRLAYPFVRVKTRPE
jgi:hypothetical protein